MPIPIRTQLQSPSKADQAGEGPSTSSTQDSQIRHQTKLPNSSASQQRPQPRTQLNATINTTNDTATSTTTTRQAREPRNGIPRSIPAASKPVPGHARSLSTASATARRVAASEATNALHGHSQASSRKADFTSAPASAVHSRTLSVAARPKPDTHSRTLSAASKTSPDSRNLHGPIPKPARPVSKVAPTVSGRPSLKKPEFNTYKQYYSPKKTPLGPPGTPAPVRALAGSASHSEGSAERRRLQDELLQLALLNDTSDSTLQAYEESITSQLTARSDYLKQQLQTLESLEGERQVKVNVHAVDSWLDARKEPHSSTSAGPNRLLILAHSIRDLREVTERGGPLEIAMQQFDEWQVRAGVRNVNDAGHEGPSEASSGFLTPLDPQWSASITSVRNRVQICAESCANLEGAPASSSIGLSIGMHSRLANEILREIAICREVESLILRQERARTEAAITQALAEAESQGNTELKHANGRRGIWETSGS